MYRLKHIPIAALALVFALFFVACDDSDPVGVNGDDGDDQVSEHGEAGQVQIFFRGDDDPVAIWSDELGWTDADNNSIDRLENPVRTDDGERQPLRAGGPSASFDVKINDGQGTTYDFFTEDTEPITDDLEQRFCSEFAGRFAIANAEGMRDRVAFPPQVHPDAIDDPQNDQFAERENGDWVQIYGCDHVNIFPEEEGEIDVAFLLWHIDHSDGRTEDDLRMTIEPAQ